MPLPLHLPCPQVVPLLLLLSVPVEASHVWQIVGVDGGLHTPLEHVPWLQEVPFALLFIVPVVESHVWQSVGTVEELHVPLPLQVPLPQVSPLLLLPYWQTLPDTPVNFLQIVAGAQQIPVWQLPLPLQPVPFVLLVTAPVLAVKVWHSVNVDGAVHTPLWHLPCPQVVLFALLSIVPVAAFHVWQIPGVEGCVHTPL